MVSWRQAIAAVAAIPDERWGIAGEVQPDGTVYEAPIVLAGAYQLDHYTLARMAASEQGDNAAELLAVCVAAINRARRSGMGVHARITWNSDPMRRGRYGENGAGYWASTARPPTMRSLAAARLASEQAGERWLGDVDAFFSPRAQDLLVGRKQGVSGQVTRDAIRVITDQAGDSHAWIGPIDGIDPYALMLFRPVRSPDTGAAIAVVSSARAGGAAPARTIVDGQAIAALAAAAAVVT